VGAPLKVSTTRNVKHGMLEGYKNEMNTSAVNANKTMRGQQQNRASITQIT